MIWGSPVSISEDSADMFPRDVVISLETTVITEHLVYMRYTRQYSRTSTVFTVFQGLYFDR
jgi:hypothetical protein